MAGETLDQTLLQPDAGTNAPPRLAMGQQGYPGLKIVCNTIQEESVTKLRMPFLIKEIDEMKRDSSVASALTFYKMMISRAEWDIRCPVGASKETQERAKFIKSCMHDMDMSWFSFIQSVLSSIDYGFCINEKVYKRRTKNNSKYDDGLVGIKSLPVRSQSSFKEWIYSTDGRTLLGFKQSTANLPSGKYSELKKSIDIEIARDKFLLFRTSPQNDNPEGTAALKSAWIAWRYKKAIEEEEMKGIGRDLGGLLNLGIPARYMSPDASSAEKSVYETFQKVTRNVANGEQSGIITPSDVDPETKQKMFTVDLMTSQGSRGYDTNKIIQRFTSQILVTLFADLLQMGADGGGSFALSDNKQDLVQFAIEFRLKEIADVLNNDLIPSLYKQNRWDMKELPFFTFSGITQTSLEEFSKAVQRLAATSSIEKDRAFYNRTRVMLGLEPFASDEEVHTEEVGEMTSRSGDGLESGLPSGTGDAVGTQNNSDNNMDNKA